MGRAMGRTKKSLKHTAQFFIKKGGGYAYRQYRDDEIIKYLNRRVDRYIENGKKEQCLNNVWLHPGEVLLFLKKEDIKKGDDDGNV